MTRLIAALTRLGALSGDTQYALTKTIDFVMDPTTIAVDTDELRTWSSHILATCRVSASTGAVESAHLFLLEQYVRELNEALDENATSSVPSDVAAIDDDIEMIEHRSASLPTTAPDASVEIGSREDSDIDFWEIVVGNALDDSISTDDIEAQLQALRDIREYRMERRRRRQPIAAHVAQLAGRAGTIIRTTSQAGPVDDASSWEQRFHEAAESGPYALAEFVDTFTALLDTAQCYITGTDSFESFAADVSECITALGALVVDV